MTPQEALERVKDPSDRDAQLDLIYHGQTGAYISIEALKAALRTPVLPIYNTPEYQRGVEDTKKMIAHLLKLHLEDT